MKSEKRSKKWIVAVVVVLLIYPIYFCIVQISTKSDSLLLFPDEGIWLAEATGYSIEIDLDQESPVVTLTIANNEKEIVLEMSQSGGHGTVFWPTSATSILHFTSETLDFSDENYISFSCSKFKFNEDDFYLRKIYTHESNNLSLIKDKTTLHFVKQNTNAEQ